MLKPNSRITQREDESMDFDIEHLEDFHQRIRSCDDEDPEMQEPRNAHEKVQVTIELTR